MPYVYYEPDESDWATAEAAGERQGEEDEGSSIEAEVVEIDSLGLAAEREREGVPVVGEAEK